MFQKVSESQIFLFEVWHPSGFISPAPSGFNGNDDPWFVKGKIGEKEFEIKVTKENTETEIPVLVEDGEKFQIKFERGEEKDFIEGTIEYL